MKFRLKSLVLSLRRGEETIAFNDVSYFWGQMGAGKTSIARLVDYCLGGKIELSPAMQTEFVSATLNLSLAHGELSIERARDADRVIAAWGTGPTAYEVNLPARVAAGEVIPGTGVEQLSDLLFWLSGITPPRVRKGKLKDDSDSARLSMRDLLWYCYLDQDEIDSSFFYLEDGAPFYLRLKSRDVLRYVIGFHSERVAEIESELDALRGERQAMAATIVALTRALKEVGAESEEHISTRINELREQENILLASIESSRRLADGDRTTVHAADQLRDEARKLSEAIFRIDEATRELAQVEDRDRRHLHEIETLALKFRRSISAKAVLVGVAFESCPRCARPLPTTRESGCCHVCGQADQDEVIDPSEGALVERDTKSRVEELKDILERHAVSSGNLQREREILHARKTRIERDRNEASSRYDSAYLSTSLAQERERAAIQQQIDNLVGLKRLPQMVEAERKKLVEVQTREQRLKAELSEVREAAESDATNLDNLKSLFLDCLVRSGVPGITANDRVEMPTTSLYPELYSGDPADRALTSFSTISSGGKKTLFKCCFAIAVHRLAVQVSAPLPELLIIDSPMKNISERENREQFEGFYDMLFELKAGELSTTQVVLIDKEFSAPAAELGLALTERHMRPDDPKFPPLIPYYKGK